MGHQGHLFLFLFLVSQVIAVSANEYPDDDDCSNYVDPFHCASDPDECISSVYHCDGEFDCSDLSDEDYCEGVECGEGKFRSGF